MDDLILKLRLLAKAEMVLFRLHLRRTLRLATLALGAVLVVVLGMAMLNVALYQYLLPHWGGGGSALAVAAADLLVAAALFAAAGRTPLGDEYEAAHELRERIVADLAAEAGRVSAQVAELQNDIRHIRTLAGSIFTPGGMHISSIVHGLVALVRSFRR